MRVPKKPSTTRTAGAKHKTGKTTHKPTKPSSTQQKPPESPAESGKRGKNAYQHAIRHRDGGCVKVDRWTLRRAISAFCTECMGLGEEHPRACKGQFCPLWPHRRKINLAVRKDAERIAEEEARAFVDQQAAKFGYEMVAGKAEIEEEQEETDEEGGEEQEETDEEGEEE